MPECAAGARTSTSSLRLSGRPAARRYSPTRPPGGGSPRAGLADALGYLRKDDVLVVRRLDRLGRDLDRLLQVAMDLDRQGARLRVLREGIDTAMDGGRLLIYLLEALAARERRSMRRT